MEEVLKTNDDSGNQYEFEENDNDSDLEGRLYAEIYFSNDIHETEKNFEDDSIKSIQDIKNASRSCIPSTSQLKSSPILKSIQNSITTEEENKSNKDQFSQGPDKNLNLEKQNQDVTLDNTPSRICNEISNKSLNSQQKLPKSQKNKSDLNKDSKNNSPVLRNGQNQNNLNNITKNMYNSPVKVNTPLSIPKSAKRKSKNDKDYESASKRRSLEHNESIDVNSDSQLYPVVLNSRKSWTGDNFQAISDGAMDILFPKGWKEKKKMEEVDKTKGKKRKNSKSTKPNANVSEKNQSIQETEREEIIEIISSESSEECSMNNTTKLKKRIENKNKSNMPIWLNSSSDSEESILEVPVPPKPSPPLVNVKDSDTNSSDSDDGIYDLNYMPSRKKFQRISDDSEQSSEENTKHNSKSTSENDTESIENIIVESLQNCQELSNQTTENHNSDYSEKNFVNNSGPSVTENFGECSYVTVESDENSSLHLDEEDDEPIQDLILNCSLPNSSPSSLKTKHLENSEVDGETRKKYSDYFESLNDNPQPSTSKVNKSIKNKSSKEKTDVEYFFEPMLEKIKAFYNDSWGGEDYSVEQVRNQMSKNPKHWAILEDDSKPTLRQQRYFLNKAKCTLCHQSGHLRANCPEPKKSPICHMCGSKGHYETRCPGKICLTCGKKQHSYRKTCESCTKLTCSLCRSRGHKKETCPDLWRQYHHTTNHSEHKTPVNMKEIMKPMHLLICCNCTKWGHEFFNCPKYRWTPHYPTPAHVRNYSKPENSKAIIDVINFEKPEASFQSLTKANETEITEIDYENLKKNGENVNNTPSKNSNKIRNSSVSIESTFVSPRKPKLDKEKLIFECEYKKVPKIRLPPEQFDRLHKERICLNDVKNANLEELIAGRTSFAFLRCLSKNLRCDIYITVTQDSIVLMSITFHALFSNRHVFRKIINLWLGASNNRKLITMKKIPNDRMALTNIFRAKFDKFNTESKSVEECYNYLKETSMWLKQNEDQTKNPEFSKKKKDMISIRNLLVTLLYKHDCAIEKNAFSKLEDFLSSINKTQKVTFNIYIWLYYYYHLIFANYLPTNLVQMLNTYFTLNAKEVNVSLNDLVFNEHQESDEEIVQHEINQKSTEENSSPNKSHSLSDVDVIISSKNLEQNRNVFTFPTADFIPISTSDSNLIVPIKERNVEHFTNNVQNSPKYQHNNSEKSNNKKKHLRKFRKLKKEATTYMNEALELNVPEITKAAIKVGDLINQTKLQRKHVTFLKRLCIKSQMKKSLKKSSKRRSFSNF